MSLKFGSYLILHYHTSILLHLLDQLSTLIDREVDFTVVFAGS